MDCRESLPTQSGSHRCVGDDGSIFKITDYDPSLDYVTLCVMFHDFWSEVHLKDLNQMSHTVSGPINEIEGQLYKYVSVDKCKVKMVFEQEKPLGFMIYHEVFDCIVAIRACYFVPEYRELGLIKKVLKSIGNVSRVFGQTYSEHPPKQAKKETNIKVKIASLKDFDVWEYKFNEES